MGQKQKQPTSSYRQALMFAVPLAILLFILVCSFTIDASQQFSLLAKAFLHHQLNFLAPIGGVGQDPILWHGKIYWGEGPLPAIILMPFVAVFQLFHLFFYQSYMSCLLILGSLFFLWRIARSLAYSKADSLILTLGFALGSVFIGVAVISSSWLFAQVVTTFLLFWALYEYFVPKRPRWWLLGIICGLVLMTRPSAAPILLFFCLEAWQVTSKKAARLATFAQLCLPVLAAALLLATYNFLRFHNPLSGGYSHQLLYPESAESRSLGVFSLVHLPANLYSALLRAPIPVLRSGSSWTLKFPYVKGNLYGMSIFMTSPYLLALFTNKWSSFNARARHLLVASLASCLLVLCFYGIGSGQFGYRYSLDFLPELFALFMVMYRTSHRRLSTGMKTLLLGSGLVNFYLLLTLI